MGRSKQKLEGYFAKSLNNDDGLYGFKLHNNPLAHQKTLCDFTVFNKYGFSFAVECKQVTCKDGKGLFAFSRLTQLKYLLEFDNFSKYNISLVCVLFYNINIKQSITFIIPINTLIGIFNNVGKKSLNLGDFERYFNSFIIYYNNGCYDLSYFQCFR